MTTASSDKLVIAVPSKGRLQDNTTAFFNRAGLTLVQEGGNRDYRGTLRGLPGAEVLFLSASEIVAKLASGDAHFGFTGEDLVREAIPDADQKVELLSPLGFGHADVVVAVPKGWIDASSMEDLEEITADFHARRGRRMRVATKYIALTRRYFAEHGVADYRIVESLGATEGAPASGTAEFIVDITTTGSTLEANALKVLEDGVILRSQANLVASLVADWPDAITGIARKFLGRISAEHAARTLRELRVQAAPEHLESLAALAEQQGATLTMVPEIENAASQIVLHVQAAHAAALSSDLIAAGASRVSVTQKDYLFEARSPLFERLQDRLAALKAV
ncbi:MAG: ATP phosphoribosyltransferase [Beijerinckiaceae bacterium]